MTTLTLKGRRCEIRYELRKITDESGKNSEKVDVLYFDGYAIGERLLEGLVLGVTVTDGVIKVHAVWPRGVDAKYWEGIATDFAKYNDVFSTTPDLNDDDGFITSIKEKEM